MRGPKRHRRKEILLSNGIFRTLSRVDSYLLRERLHLRTARNGREILRQAHREMPDVVIVEHPTSDLSAAEICAALKRRGSTASQPLVLVAGPTRPADIETQCRAAGCDRYIGARRSPARILSEIASALRIRCRRHERVPAVIPVAVGRVASEFLGYTRDVSECGVLVESALRVEKGRRMRLRLFETPNASPLLLDAIVRRLVPGEDDDQHFLGMELLDMDRVSGARLRKYLVKQAGG